jgi:hypothetical protein
MEALYQGMALAMPKTAQETLWGFSPCGEERSAQGPRAQVFVGGAKNRGVKAPERHVHRDSASYFLVYPDKRLSRQ